MGDLAEVRAGADAEAAARTALAALPDPIRALLGRLQEAGLDAYLVGGCVRDLVRGEAVHDFDVATAARPEAVLELFPRAVPINLRHGTVMVPTPAGPVDVTTLRAGPRIEDDLAHRDYTVNAMAAAAHARRLIDPHGGLADLRARRLRAVGCVEARFAEDPIRALRGIRLAVTLELELDPAIEPAIAAARGALRALPRERVRGELERILLAPAPARGLELLRRTGIEVDLAPGVRSDAARVVAALPADLALRLAGWLRGTRPDGPLSRLRFSKRLAQRVAKLVRLHPIDARPDADEVDARRLIKQAGEENIDALLALCEAELEAGARHAPADDRAALDRLRALLDRVRSSRDLALHRLDLALDGVAVMGLLGCGPGPRVGRALRYLTQQVLVDPARNTPEGLKALLESWRDPGGGKAGEDERRRKRKSPDRDDPGFPGKGI